MQDKRVESIKEVRLRKFRDLTIAVYGDEKYPDQIVCRLFDIGDPTNIIMVKNSMEEITQDLQAAGRIFLHRRRNDPENLIGIWIGD